MSVGDRIGDQRGTSYNSCFTGSGRVRALRPNFGPVMPRAGARAPPGPKFGKADTLSVAANRKMRIGSAAPMDRLGKSCGTQRGDAAGSRAEDQR